MTERRRAVTIADVAADAGVSQASVSRVLNDNPTVDPAIARKVHASIRRLGYAPSAAARSLAQGRSRTIAMVVPDLENPLFQGILKGLSRAADADGYRVLVADTAERVDAEAAIATEARHRCDAVVLCAPRTPEGELLPLVERLSPAIVVNRQVPDARLPVVGIDYARGIRDLVEHLAFLGHRRMLYVGGPTESASDAERRRGIAEAAAASPDLSIDTIACGSQLDDGYAIADRVVEAQRGGVTAVLAFNDLVAFGLLNRLTELGVDVPRDLSLAGFDDVPMARFTTPRLTSMSVPRAEVGAQAWARLRTLMDGGPVEHAMLYRPRLEARESTAQVAEARGSAPVAEARG